MHGIDFEIEEGEVFGLLGPNGAGKTTTVEILEGYRRRDAGEVTVLGHDPQSPGPEFRERIGVVLQQSELWPNLTVRETHRVFAGYYRAAARRRRGDRLVGLTEKRDARSRRSRVDRSDGSISASRSSATPISCSSTSRRRDSTRLRAAPRGR